MNAKSSFRSGLVAYAAALTLCAGAFAFLFQPWKIDPRVPIDYQGDALVHTGWIMNIVETGWYESNDRWGYPGRQDLRDFPSTDSLHHLTCKGLALFTSDACLLFNVFYFLTFPLTTIIALFVLRRLGVSAPVAVVISLLYTFQPYHLLRVGHLLLSAYYLVPFACLFAVRIYQDRSYWAAETDHRSRGRSDGILAGLCCVAIGGSGAYYAFFSCFLMLVGGLAGAWTNRRWSPLLRAGSMCAIAFLAFVASAASALEHRLTEPNADVAERHPADAEVFGLKIVHMLLPVRGHRLAILRDLEGAYSLGPTPLNNENATAALGMLGAIGLVYLLGRAVLHRGTGAGNTLDALAVLALAAVLLGTIGGFGSAFSFFVSPWIRGYNRISIFIAFLALTAVGLLFDSARRRWCDAPEAATVKRRCCCLLVLSAMGIGGMLDQTHRRLMHPAGKFHEAFHADRDFVRRLEASVPAGSAIAQWPNCPYPNWIFRFDKFDFNGHEHLRPQVHSRTLRWSYGAMPGHRGYVWNRRVEAMALEQKLIALADAGFQGVCINRWGYADCGTAILNEVQALLGPPVLTSRDDRLFYFDLSELRARLNANADVAERERRRDLALHPVLIYWSKGFYEEQEKTADREARRWGQRHAELIVENEARVPQTVCLRFTVAVPETSRDYPLHVHGDLFATNIKVGRNPAQFERNVVVPPGRHRVNFDCEAPAQPVWQEPEKRGIVFRITHFACEDVPGPTDAERLCRETARLRR